MGSATSWNKLMNIKQTKTEKIYINYCTGVFSLS